MKANPIHIDFASAALPAHSLGVAILALGSIALLGGAFVWSEAWSAQAGQAHALAALQSQEAQAAARSAQPVAVNPAELARDRAALKVARGLQTPWSDLLGALEAAASDSVALLAVEPSTIKQAVRLSAEARDPQDMLGYLAALQADARLSQVVLVSHQVQTQAPGTPVRFQLQASWGATP